MKKLLFSVACLFSVALTNATTYYVDFENGNNTNNGTSKQSAWKHAPGDATASGIPANVALEPGDSIIFRGGISYRGNITISASGTAENPICYVGNVWGTEKAIIDGSAPVTGWSQLNDSIYVADIPSEFSLGETSASINLHEFDFDTSEDNYLWTAQTPDPSVGFFYDNRYEFFPVANHNITRSSITDSAIFNQTDPNYWINSSLLIWTNPNWVVLRKITDFDPEAYTVSFDSLNAEAIYPDLRDQSFAVYNSIHAMDKPGEYVVDFEQGKIFLYPRNADNIERSVSASMRKFGISLGKSSGVIIDGFVVQKHSGEGLRDGIGIGNYTSSDYVNRHVAIKNNVVTHNRHPHKGYGGIYISNAANCRVEHNQVFDNFKHKGIFGNSVDSVVVAYNTVQRVGNTGISFYRGNHSQIIYNRVLDCNGSHANGITVYIASSDILVAGNRIINCSSPITFQDSGDMYFFNNLIVSSGDQNGVNEWGRTSRGPWANGEIVFVNNTFISEPKRLVMNIESSLDTIIDGTDSIFANTYISYNNIIDAGGGANNTNRSHNIYTSLNWDQSDKYQWSLGVGESINDDRESLFIDYENGDFSLKESSSATGTGINPLSVLPVDKFPDFDFESDILEHPRPKNEPWSIGAFEFGTDPSNSSPVQTAGTLSTVPTGLNHSSDLSIFPNPSSGLLWYDSDNYAKAEVYTISGKYLFSSSSSPMNLESLLDGVYVIKLWQRNGGVVFELVTVKK